MVFTVAKKSFSSIDDMIHLPCCCMHIDLRFPPIHLRDQVPIEIKLITAGEKETASIAGSSARHITGKVRSDPSESSDPLLTLLPLACRSGPAQSF